MSNHVASCRDEQLAEKFNQFSVLYDKSCSTIHAKMSQMILSLKVVSAEKFVPEAAVEMCS